MILNGPISILRNDPRQAFLNSRDTAFELMSLCGATNVRKPHSGYRANPIQSMDTAPWWLADSKRAAQGPQWPKPMSSERHDGISHHPCDQQGG